MEKRRIEEMEEEDAEEKRLLVEEGSEEEEEGEVVKKNVKKGKGEEEKEGLVDLTRKETKKLWIVAGPAIFARFSHFGIAIISQAFVGHIGATQFAALALISTVLLRFANGILVRSAPPSPLPSNP